MICETYEQDHSQTDFCDFGFCLREIIATFLDSEKKEEKKEGGWGLDGKSCKTFVCSPEAGQTLHDENFH